MEIEVLTRDRFLAIVLPALTLSTHLLLSLSFALPGDDKTWAFWSLTYNGLAAVASVLGLVGAVRVSSLAPRTALSGAFPTKSGAGRAAFVILRFDY